MNHRHRFFLFLLRHRSAVLLLTAVTVGIAAWGARRARIDYGVEQFFLPSGIERDRYDEFKRQFPREDTRVSLFVWDHGGPTADTYAALNRAAAWFARSGLTQIQWAGNISVPVERHVDGDTVLSVEPVLSADDDAVAIRRAMRRHRDHRLLSGFVWDTSLSVLALHGYLRPQDNTDSVRRRLEAQLEDSVTVLRTPGRTVVLTGLPIARARAPVLLESDISMLLTLTFAILFVILFWFFRQGAPVVLSLGSVAPAYLCVLGIHGLVGRPISILTSFVPIVVLVVGMTDAVHVLSHYYRRRVRGDRHGDIADTFSVMVGPCFYTSLTTAAGFASLAGTRIGIVVDFGVVTAAAIMLVFAFSMTLFPVLLSFAPDRPAVPPGRTWLDPLVARVATQSPRRNRAVLVATVALTMAGIWSVTRLRVNTFLIDDTRPSAPFIQDIAWINDHGFGFFQINVVLTGSGVLHTPALLRWMEEIRVFARSDPLVTHVASPTDFLVESRQALSAGDASLPPSVEEAGQLLLLAQLQDPAFVRDVYVETAGVAQIILTVRDEGSRVITPFLNRLRSHLEANPPPGAQVHVTGTVAMIHEFTERLLQSFGPSIAAAIVMITGIMMIMLRSVRLGMIALLPNLLPLLAVLAAIAWLGFSLKPSTILVLSVAFGIAVDDTIHFLGRVRSHAGGHRSMGRATAEGIRDAGPTLVVTTAIVTLGFLTLTLAHFEVLVLIGLMTAISAVAALAADLFLVPAILTLARDGAA